MTPIKRTSFFLSTALRSRKWRLVRGFDSEGIVDSQDRVVIPCIYQEIIFIYNDVVAVRYGNKIGLKHLNEETIVNFIYKYVECKDNEVDIGETMYESSENLSSDDESYIPEIYEGTHDSDYISDETDEFESIELEPFEYKYEENRFLIVSLEDQRNGIIDLETFIEVLPCEYHSITKYYNFINYFEIRQYGQSGMFFAESNKIIPCLFWSLRPAVNTIVLQKQYDAVYTKGLYAGGCGFMSLDGLPIYIEGFSRDYVDDGYIDARSEYLKILYFQEIKILPDGKYLINYRGKYGVLSQQFVILVPCLFSNISNFSNEISVFSIDKSVNQRIVKLHGYITNTGRIITEGSYKKICPFSCYRGVIIRRKDVDEFSVVDNEGNIVVPFGIYQNMQYEFKNDTLIVGNLIRGFIFKSMKYGLINKSGLLLIPAVYDSIERQDGGLFIVQKNDLYGQVDVHNNILISIIHGHRHEVK